MLSSRTDGVENPKDSIVGDYYEHPMIGYDAPIGSQQSVLQEIFEHQVARSSMQIIVFRAVPVEAP